jgi:hypothetical protein
MSSPNRKNNDAITRATTDSHTAARPDMANAQHASRKAVPLSAAARSAVRTRVTRRPAGAWSAKSPTVFTTVTTAMITLGTEVSFTTHKGRATVITAALICSTAISSVVRT